MKKISVILNGAARTSVSLEPEFHEVLIEAARDMGLSVNALVAKLDAGRTAESNNLSSTIRAWCVQHLRRKLDG